MTLLRRTRRRVTIYAPLSRRLLMRTPMFKSYLLSLPILAICLAFVSAPAAAQSGSSSITFKRTQLDSVFRSEGVAVGDFNKDGKNDIAAGYVWYSAPDWKMHVTGDKAPEFDPHGYSNAFQAFAADINGDGRHDITHVGWLG